MTTTNNSSKLQIPPSISKFDDDPGAWKVYKADLRAIFVINNLDGVVDNEPLARAQAVYEATPRPRVEAVLDGSGNEISPAVPAYVPSETQLLAISRHDAAVRSAYSLIVLTTGPRVKQMIAEFDGDGPAAYHHLLRHYESDDMYAVLDLFWATLSTKLPSGADRTACIEYESKLVDQFSLLKSSGHELSGMLKMAIFLGNLPKDQSWENWLQGIRHARNKDGDAISFSDVRNAFNSEVVRRNIQGVSASSSSDAIASVAKVEHPICPNPKCGKRHPGGWEKCWAEGGGMAGKYPRRFGKKKKKAALAEMMQAFLADTDSEEDGSPPAKQAFGPSLGAAKLDIKQVSSNSAPPINSSLTKPPNRAAMAATYNAQLEAHRASFQSQLDAMPQDELVELDVDDEHTFAAWADQDVEYSHMADHDVGVVPEACLEPEVSWGHSVVASSLKFVGGFLRNVTTLISILAVLIPFLIIGTADGILQDGFNGGISTGVVTCISVGAIGLVSDFSNLTSASHCTTNYLGNFAMVGESSDGLNVDLANVLYVPEVSSTLWSHRAARKQGFKLHSDPDSGDLWYSVPGSTAKIRIVDKGSLYGIELSPNSTVWQVWDTGCSMFMTNDRAGFINLKSHKGKIKTARKGVSLDIKGIGTYRARLRVESNTTSKSPSPLVVPRPGLLQIDRQGRSKEPAGGDASGRGQAGKAVGQTYAYNNFLEVSNQLPSTIVESDLVSPLFLNHVRYGHLNYKDLKLLLTKQGVKVGNASPDQCKCPICLRAKQARRKKMKVRVSKRMEKPLELVHLDWQGPFKVAAMGTLHKYACVLVDDCSRRSWVYTCRHKSNYLDILKDFRSRQAVKGHALRGIQCDNDSVFNSQEAREYYLRSDIATRFSGPYQQWQNGVVERMMRTLMEMVRAMMFTAMLSAGYWAYALKAASYVRNHCPSVALGFKCPMDWFPEESSGAKVRIFGSPVSIKVPTKAGNLNSVSKEARFVGYSNEHKGCYELLDHSGRKLVRHERDLVFHEVDMLIANKSRSFENQESFLPGDSYLQQGVAEEQITSDNPSARIDSNVKAPNLSQPSVFEDVYRGSSRAFPRANVDQVVSPVSNEQAPDPSVVTPKLIDDVPAVPANGAQTSNLF